MTELAQSSNEVLLRTFASLTHEMHGMHKEDSVDIRQKRDLVEAEILRRMGL